jgi:hypothetical protein
MKLYALESQMLLSAALPLLTYDIMSSIINVFVRVSVFLDVEIKGKHFFCNVIG